jgi:hypothetical protein
MSKWVAILMLRTCYKYIFGNICVNILKTSMLAKGWTVRGSNPCGCEIVRTCPDGPWDNHASCRVDNGPFRGVKRPGRGVDHLLPSSAEVKERAIPLLPFWASVACSRIKIYLLPLLYTVFGAMSCPQVTNTLAAEHGSTLANTD